MKKVQYLVDDEGRKVSALLPIKDYIELLESAQDVIDASLIDEVKEEARISWEEVKNKKRAQG